MKNILFKLLLILPMIVFSQIQSYDYWFDNDYANKVSQNVTLTPILNLNENLITSGVQDGVHTINIRFKDENNDWSSVLSQFFYKVPDVYLVSNPKMVQFEYWFDNNYADRVTESVTPNQIFNLDSNLITNTLLDGVHTINIRFKDENNDWSSVLSQFFYKVPDVYLLPNPNMVQFEYWFDNNYADRVTESVTPNQIFNLDSNLITNTLLDGVHTINIRFKDENNDWSSVLSQFFYKVPDEYLVPNPNMVQYEYWFDNNYADRVTESVTPNQIFNLDSNLITNALLDGVHTINIRFKDENNDWSSVLSQFFYKNADNSIVIREIDAYAFWFNDDYDNAVLTNISPIATFNLDTFVLPENFGLGIGTHQLNFHFKDNSNLWSSVLTSEFEITALEVIETTFKNVVIYPNPTTGELNIKLDQFYNYIHISVIDFNGRLVESKRHEAVTDIQLHLNYPTGFYMLIIENDGKKSAHKIIKR